MSDIKLTNGELSQELQNLIGKADGELPQEITNQILTIMIQDTNRGITRFRTEVNECLEEKTSEILAELSIMKEINAEVNRKVDAIEEDRKKYPSLPKWIAKHKKQTFYIISTFFIASQIWFISGFRYIVLSTILYAVGNVIGLPKETIEQILAILFA